MADQAKIDSMSVLIPDGGTWDAVRVACCLRQTRTVTTHVLANARWPLARFSRYCSSHHCHTSENDDDWISVIRSLVRRLRIAVILPVTGDGVAFVARNRTAISEFVAIAPVADFELFVMLQDKWSFHCFAEQNGFPVPASTFVGVPGVASIASLDLDSVEYPALLKPTLQKGGFGIVRVEEPSDVERVWNDESMMKGHPYMLQSYEPGVDLCLQVFCKKGEILEYTVQKSLMLSENHFGPQRIMEFAEDDGAVEVGRRLVSVAGFEGIGCIDFRIDPTNQTQRILEMNPRFGQAILGSLVAGVNFPLLACADALGLEYPLMQRKTTKYAHPVAYFEAILSRLIGRSAGTTPLLWRESGLQFICGDPIPALVDAVRKTTRLLQRRIGGSRSRS